MNSLLIKLKRKSVHEVVSDFEEMEDVRISKKDPNYFELNIGGEFVPFEVDWCKLPKSVFLLASAVTKLGDGLLAFNSDEIIEKVIGVPSVEEIIVFSGFEIENLKSLNKLKMDYLRESGDYTSEIFIIDLVVK